MIPRFKSPSINSVTSRAYEILNVSRNNYYPGTESLFDAFLLPAHYSLQCRQEQAGWRNRRGSRQFFEGAKDILPKFPQIARNFSSDKLSPYRFSAAPNAFYFTLQCCHRLKNMKSGT